MLSSRYQEMMMQTPINAFKAALAAKKPQIGLWLGLANAYTSELCAGAGFDWLLLDGEHAPNDVRSLLPQLQALAAYPSHAVARPPVGETALIKQYLDLGVQTLLVPMVDTAEHAQALVRAMRYAPQGVRGMGSAIARASRWQRYPHYADEANAQMCLLVQAETATAIENLDALCAVEGVDGIFIGPADLSASMGYRGQPGHPKVQSTIDEAIARIRKAGKAPGILSTDERLARRYLEAGALFVAVGVDTSLLAKACDALAAHFKGFNAPTVKSGVH
jgi:4-hydroxy-2-oxoheptanedioate aldolase